MSERFLPCPRCQEPIPMRPSDFFPSRRYGVRCPTCARVARIPLRVVLIGLVVMLAELAVLGWILAAADVFHPETIGALVGSGLALLGGIAFVVWSLSVLGRALIHDLE